MFHSIQKACTFFILSGVVMHSGSIGSQNDSDSTTVAHDVNIALKTVGAFDSGSYRNFINELLGVPRPQVQAKVENAFRQLFHGDEKTQSVYYSAGSDMAYIKDVLHKDVRSEGMSYGMLIAVQLDKKAEFDRLWKWAKIYMQHGTGARRNYFAWLLNTDGTVMDSNSASDGEEYFATALFFASARWGNGTGIFNYRAQAQAILDAMLDKSEHDVSDTTITNMFRKSEKQVVLVPFGKASEITDPSYHLPHFYELWAYWADKDNAFWRDAASASREFLHKAAHPITGLTPDYARFDGSPFDPWNGGHADFRFDAWRTVMNAAVDYDWFAKDPREVLLCDRILEFFHGQGMKKYGNQFTLEGVELSNDRSPGLLAMNAVACLASTRAYKTDFLREFWNTDVPTGIFRYYDGMLYMLALLHLSGNFRIYSPASGR
jgi:oligosaccharide reducing-end xylanase